MEKYCPNCNKSYGETDKNFCTACGEQLAPVTTAAKSPTESLAKEISIVNNKIVWNVPVGEIAYKISEQEMDSLLGAQGIVVDEGVTAYIYIDGRLASEIHGGNYDFVSKEELDRKLNARMGGMAEKLKNVWKVITRFWVGTSIRERMERNQGISQMSSVDEVVDSIRRNAVYSIILKVDKEFPLVFENTLQTARFNGKIGIGLMARITDFHQFIRQLVENGGRKRISCTDIRELLKGAVADSLSGEDIANGQLPDGIRQRLLNRMQAQVAQMQAGITVTRITDCSMASEDLERLRRLDREIYLSEAELERLHKINIIKNRLASEEAQQQIEAARGELGIFKAMSEINRDRLLTEDELQAFVETIANARRLRAARNQEEFDAAVVGIRKAQILRETDIQLLVAEANEKIYQRSTAFSLMQLRDTIERNKIEQAATHDMQQQEMVHQVGLARIKDAYQDERFLKQLELENEQFKYGLEQRRQSHQQDMVEQMDNISILDGMRELEEKKRQADHQRQMEALNMQQQYELKRQYIHEVDALKIKSTMTAEQLAAEQLAQMSPEAQAAYFSNLHREEAAAARAQAEREKAEYTERLSTMMIDRLSGFTSQAMSALSGAATHDRQRAEDYKADLHREQERYDRHQEQVTRYMLGGKPAPAQPAAPQPTAQPVQPQQPTVRPPMAASGSQIVNCPKCGKPNDLNDGSFCAYCREPLK